MTYYLILDTLDGTYMYSLGKSFGWVKSKAIATRFDALEARRLAKPTHLRMVEAPLSVEQLIEKYSHYPDVVNDFKTTTMKTFRKYCGILFISDTVDLLTKRPSDLMYVAAIDILKKEEIPSSHQIATELKSKKITIVVIGKEKLQLTATGY